MMLCYADEDSTSSYAHRCMWNVVQDLSLIHISIDTMIAWLEEHACGCAKTTYKPVSYTHLDPAEASAAYPWIIATDSPKDTVTGLFAHKFAEEVERLSNGSIPVSYTHLDVYKRQVMSS